MQELKMTWNQLLEMIETEGTFEEVELMKPREFTISQLSDLLGVTPIRIYQLQKRKKSPLPLTKGNGKKGRNVWTIKELPLLSWIEQEETKIDSRKKVDYSKVHEYFDEVFEQREEIIDRFMEKVN